MDAGRQFRRFAGDLSAVAIEQRKLEWSSLASRFKMRSQEIGIILPASRERSIEKWRGFAPGQALPENQ